MANTGSPAKFQWTNVLNQYFATIAANLIILSQGSTIGWNAPALITLTSKENTPLIDGALSNDQVSWIGSINCIGAIIGSLSFGYIVSLLGPKRSITLLMIPSLAFWLLIYFGNVYYHILLARFISGIAGGGMQTSLILYITEIANDDIRGRLGSMMLLMRNIGTLLSFVLGAAVDYFLIPIICITVPIIFAICFIPLPNTPQFYLHKRNIEKAEKALKYYKGYKGESDIEEVAFFKEFERLKSVANEQKSNATFQASNLWNRNALKGIGIAVALASFSQLTAGFTIINYAHTIFQALGTSMDAYLCSIVLAVALIFGSLTSSILADKLGRKILNIISLLGCAAGLFATAIYHYLNQNGYDLSLFTWVPVFSLSFVIFISAAGIWGLVLVCIVEYLPQNIRTFGMAITVVVISFTNFISAKIFPFLMVTIGLHGCLTVFGVCSVVGSAFVFCVMNETKGKSLDDVGKNEKAKAQNTSADNC